MPHFGNVVRAGPVGCASRSSHTVRCVREARGDVFLRLPPLAPLASDLATRNPILQHLPRWRWLGSVRHVDSGHLWSVFSANPSAVP